MRSFLLYLVTGPIKQPLEIFTLRLDSNNLFNKYIYAINVSIINKTTVYTRVYPGDRTKIYSDHGYYYINCFNFCLNH